ncbi:MAG: type I-C CRISPR-associated protein Cas8c/Csd1 [Desulfobacterales bacterium]
MSWIQKLYETYNNCESAIGNTDDEIPLLPICHTTQKAHIEITIDGNGNFLRASVVPKNNARTIIPCTECSGGRTSGEAPHPLCDKLQYVAADYLSHGGNKESFFNSYEKQLSEWFSVSSHPKIGAILNFIQKKDVVDALGVAKILHIGVDGKLIKQWDNEDIKAPDIFSILPGKINKKGKIENWQADAFIRWSVEIPGDPQSSVWTDRDIWNCWIKYYSNVKAKKAICYVKGENILVADQHPAKIRNDGDKAKLISSNDMANFTFRGRFSNADQACNVGFDVTQKAHNALRWLIAKQGYRKSDQAIVAWAISGSTIPDPFSDTLGLFDDEEMRSEITLPTSTAQHLGINLSKLIAGYYAKIGSTDGIVFMGIDSATPGRMAITFYRELTGSDFLKRIQNWHESCAWWQDYGKDKETKKAIRFVGAPSPSDIAWAAYGRRIDDKLRKATIERILPCIVDGMPIPRDIVESAFRHVCNRVGFELWEWEKTLGITCAIYKQLNPEGRYDMALEEDRRTRDYLYGRLLALADGLEGWALKDSGEKRETNAARLMQRFASHPYSTWKSIELALLSYKARLGGKARKYNDLMDTVHALFNTEDYMSDKPLSGEFLLGYHCQRKALFSLSKEQEIDKQTEEQDEN